ncbi:MAG: tetratricopeptide repeat protein [Rariglobus sp.]
MSAHLQRAHVLLAQSRPADAERELLPALASAPDSAEVHALLAICRIRLERAAEALPCATTAIGLAPGWAFTHYVHALVLRDLKKFKAVLDAVAEAIRIDSHDADHFTLQASIHLQCDDWTAALASADEALRLNPEDNTAANLRAMALVRLGRKDEAVHTVSQNLSRNPNDAFSHANQGWNALHRNDPLRAQEHFREALRLDASLDYARQGLLEALKARNPVYRAMLAYFLWSGRASQKIQWAFILGVIFGNRIIGSLSDANPQLAWFFIPLQVLFYAFIYLSWTAGPMFNFALLFDRFGRHVLTKHERNAALIFGASFLIALAILVWWMAGGAGLIITIMAAYLSAFVATTVSSTGRRLRILGFSLAALAALGLGGLALAMRGNPDGITLVRYFMWGSLGFTVLANVVRNK